MATAADIAAAQAELDLIVDARNKILERGQEVSLNGRRLTRADLVEINKMIQRVKVRIQRLQGGGSMRRAVPE